MPVDIFRRLFSRNRVNVYCSNEMRTNRVRKKAACCDAMLLCDKPAPTVNHFRSKRTCDFWCTSMIAGCNNERSLLCDAFCGSMKASASGRSSSLFQRCHDKCGGGCTRESKPQMPHSQARYLKCDAPHPNGTCPQGTGGTALLLWPIAPSGSRSHQNLSTRKHRFSFLAHTTIAWTPLC